MLNWRIECFSGGRHVCQRFSTLLRVAAACVFFGSVRSGAAAPSVEEIAAGVEAQFNKLRTSRLYCEYRWESKPIKPGQEVAFPWKEIVFAMENNRKFYLKHRAPHDQPSGVARIIVQESAFDGAAATNLTGVMGYVLKEPKGVYWLDMYLQQIGYVLRPKDKERASDDARELMWLPYCFRKAKYRVHDTQESVDGAICYVLEAPGVDKMWLAPSEGYGLRKREMTYGPETPLKLRITNRKWREVSSGIWLPYESVRDDLGRPDDPDYHGRVIVRSTLTMKQLRVNRDLPAGMFRLQFPIGTRVQDELKGIVYRVSAPGINHIDESISREEALRSEGLREETRLVILLLVVGTAGIVAWLSYLRWRRVQR
jgi:hypothetical protein